MKYVMANLVGTLCIDPQTSDNTSTCQAHAVTSRLVRHTWRHVDLSGTRGGKSTCHAHVVTSRLVRTRGDKSTCQARQVRSFLEERTKHISLSHNHNIIWCQLNKTSQSKCLLSQKKTY